MTLRQSREIRIKTINILCIVLYNKITTTFKFISFSALKPCQFSLFPLFLYMYTKYSWEVLVLDCCEQSWTVNGVYKVYNKDMFHEDCVLYLFYMQKILSFFVYSALLLFILCVCYAILFVSSFDVGRKHTIKCNIIETKQFSSKLIKIYLNIFSSYTFVSSLTISDKHTSTHTKFISKWISKEGEELYQIHNFSLCDDNTTIV